MNTDSPSSDPSHAVAPVIAALRERVGALLLASSRPDWTPAAAADELHAVAQGSTELAALLDAARAERDADNERINDLLEVLYGIAGLDFSRRALVTDNQGALDALATAINMLSEELQAAHAGLRLLASIVENSQDAIVSYQLNGVVVTWNRGAEVLYGCRAGEAVGGLVDRFIPPDRARDHARLVARVLDGERFANFETVHLRLDGTLVPVSLSAAPLVDATDKVTAISTIVRDVSVAHRLADELQRAKEAAEMAAAAKSQLLANMSHEIRTPLTALLGFAELLGARTIDDAERLNYAQIVRRNGEHLLTLLNDILDLSKIEAGKLVIDVVDCALTDVLTDLASLMRPRASERRLDFDVHLLTPIPVTVRTDPTRLRQILLNLVSNAIKFTPEGSVRVVVRYETRARPPRLIIDVVDTGIGIAPESAPGLFQAFEQGDASMSRRFGGTGLGLAICRPLARALGGDISVLSIVGEGSTFTLSLTPEVPADVIWVRGLSEAPPRARSTSRSRELCAPEPMIGRVLVVEDGPDNQVLIRALLHRHGLEVTVVENGEQAIERVVEAAGRGCAFDVILMDMQMPVLDGYGATAQLRRLGRREPIVALTAHAMAGERERCMAAGCDEFLSKPIDREAFEATVRRYVRPAPKEAPPADAEPAEAAPLYSEYRNDPSEADLLEAFVGSLPARVDALRVARASAGTGEEMARLSHQLKGAAGGYGFPDITRAAAKLEGALRAHEPDAVVDAALRELAGLCLRARA